MSTLPREQTHPLFSKLVELLNKTDYSNLPPFQTKNGLVWDIEIVGSHPDYLVITKNESTVHDFMLVFANMELMEWLIGICNERRIENQHS